MRLQCGNRYQSNQKRMGQNCQYPSQQWPCCRYSKIITQQSQEQFMKINQMSSLRSKKLNQTQHLKPNFSFFQLSTSRQNRLPPQPLQRYKSKIAQFPNDYIQITTNSYKFVDQPFTSCKVSNDGIINQENCQSIEPQSTNNSDKILSKREDQYSNKQNMPLSFGTKTKKSTQNDDQKKSVKLQCVSKLFSDDPGSPSQDFQFGSLKSHSIQALTPITEKMNRFLDSMDKDKFMNSHKNNKQFLNYHNSNRAYSQSISESHLQNISQQPIVSKDFFKIKKSSFQDKYQGNLVNGRLEGRGKIIKTDGSIYEGTFKQGKAHGMGTYNSIDGTTYQGQWSHNLFNGYGKLKYSDLGQYIGYFKEGKRHGRGSYMYKGCSYEGYFIEDRMQGNGSFMGDNGEIYIGEWMNNKKHGKGQYKWPNGDTFYGYFSNDRKDGEGVLKYADGSVYEGNWKADHREGEGCFTFNNKKIIGQWKQGRLVYQYERH